MRRRTMLGLGALGSVTAFGAGVAAYSVGVERRAYTLRRAAVPVLAPGTPAISLLHVSDLHLLAGQKRLIRWLQRLDELEPDIVVNTGDNLSSVAAVDAVQEALAPLMARPGAFVFGSNDYYGPRPKNPVSYLFSHSNRDPEGHRRPLPAEDLAAGFRDAGWLDLRNATGSIDVLGHRVDLVGVDDPHIQRDRYSEIARPAAPDAAVTIGVTHAPYAHVLDAMQADGCRLLLAGHTHGGQVCLPGGRALTANCDVGLDRARGVSRWWLGAGSADAAPPADAAWLHVSAGLGTNPFTPFRFACRPEATLLTLVARRG